MRRLYWLALIAFTSTSAHAQSSSATLLEQMAPWAASVIAQTDAPETVFPGLVKKGATLFSIPYRYRHTFRLKGDAKAVTFMNIRRTLVKAGEIGFKAGTFSSTSHNATVFDVMGVVTKPAPEISTLRCVFTRGNDEQVNWRLPVCFNTQDSNSKVVQWVTISSNIPKTITSATGSGALFYSAPDVDDADAAIDHDFKLNVVFFRWIKGKPVVELYSEGSLVADGLAIEPEADGTASIRLTQGVLTLKPVQGDDHAATVAFDGYTSSNHSPPK